VDPRNVIGIGHGHANRIYTAPARQGFIGSTGDATPLLARTFCFAASGGLAQGLDAKDSITLAELG